MSKTGHSFKRNKWALFITLILLAISFQSGMCQSAGNKFEDSSAMWGRKFNLMPLPTKVVKENGSFRLDSTFTIAVEGKAGHRIYPYASRVLRRLSGRTGLFFKQDYVTPKASVDSANLIIKIGHPIKLHLGMDESYHLEVKPGGITLTSNTDVGALRGLETFLQLLKANKKGYYFPAVDIHDSPRFKWRGLMIDCSRHFMPIAVIKRNIDGMAAMKLNVFHWHLTDYQGFRAQSKTFPKLTKDGSDGKYYSQAQMKDIIKYANQRGIRVVPEFDMPGHTISWFVGYPKLASGPGPYKIERHFGVFDPAMDPIKPYTYNFISKFLNEMTSLFPDKYFHIGGDEVNGKQWDANKKIQAFMKSHNIKNNEQLQAYFNQHLLKMLTKDHKNMVGWGEILHPGMPHSIVIQSWRGTKAMVEAAKKGYRSILSNGYYLDLVQPTSVYYLNNPLPPGMDLTKKQKESILGGEATMWSEFITPETVDSRIWPSMAAISEDLWSIHAPDIKIPNGFMKSVPDS
ncbi:MAG TPA: beta-N-acetylhexosaminidase, partial [Balneolales bacterium]|nr:beta-N-acetylhexosaminidase [Balneolales bacterium]